MKRFFSLYIVFVMNIVFSQSVSSPSNKISVNFKLTATGQPTYTVNYKNKPVILENEIVKLLQLVNHSNFNKLIQFINTLPIN